MEPPKSEMIETSVIHDGEDIRYIIRTHVADRKWIGQEPNSRLMIRFEGSWEFIYLGNDCKLQIGNPIEIRIGDALPSQPPI